MTYIKMFLAVALLVTAQNTSTSAQSPVSPSGVPKTDDFSYLANTFDDKCVSGNCVNGKGRKEYANGDVYEGDFVDGKRRGKGVLTYKNGDVYVGDFIRDRKEGHGTLTFKDGGVYVGQFGIDLFYLKGTMKYANGDIYEGDWAIGMREGQGTYKAKNGQIYVGQFGNDKFNGKGKMTFPDGERYEGDWVDNVRSGKGKSTYPIGDIYDGDYVNGSRQGQGIYSFENGDQYAGEWKNNNWNGFGKYYAKATNTIKEGTWKDNVLVNSAVAAISTKQCVSDNCTNGIGTAKYPSGDIYEGNFVNGSPSGKGKTRMSDGSTYEGNYVNGKAEGQGVFTHKGGSVYTGNFANNVNHGRGKITFTDGNSYDGEWLNGKYEGQGTYAYKDGSYYTGGWKNGQQNGYGKQYNKPANKLYEGIWKDDFLVKPTTAAASTPTDSSKCLSGNCLNGFGKYLFANGNTYEGYFVDGRGNGKGKVTNTDGSTYVGDLVNGKMEGRGIYLYANGNTYDGGWLGNLKSGQGKQTLKQSGELYVGQFANDKRHGKGKATYKNGDTYDGDWGNGLREGQATYNFPNGSYYIGGFLKDKQHGTGKQFNKLTNNTIEGIWQDGKFANSAATTKVTTVDSGPKLPVDAIATQLRETLNGKYDYLDRKPLTYIFTNKKTNEVLRYQIEFIDDGGKLAFRWKESTKKEQSEKLVITDEAIRSATKFINFFSTKTAIAPDGEIAFILSQKLHKDLKAKNEISLDLGTGIKRYTYLMSLSASSGTYTDKRIKVLHFQGSDGTKIQILDDPICPLIIKIETAEFTLTLV